MLNISKAISAATLKEYHEKEFANSSRAYYSENQQVSGQWHGQLAAELGLAGAVDVEHFNRLADGQNPFTGEQLIRYRTKPKENPAPTYTPLWVSDKAEWAEYLEQIFRDALWDAPKEEGVFKPSAGAKLAPLDRRAPPLENKPYEPSPYTETQGVLLEMHRVAAQIFRGNLEQESGATARNYLESRNVSEALSGEFRLGVSDKSGCQLVKALEHFGPENMEASGLFIRLGNGEFRDRFRDRVMIPLQNASGDVIGFAGRILDDNLKVPKYLNSPATELYDKGGFLYNLNRAQEASKETGRLVLVEGYLDAIAAHSAGIKDVIAIGGTALTDKQIETIERTAGTAIVNLDGDEPGIRASQKHIGALLNSGIQVRAVTLDGDPAGFVEKQGKAAYRSRIDHAESLPGWFLDIAGRQFFSSYNPETGDRPYELANALRTAKDGLEQVPEADRYAIALQLEQHLGITGPASGLGKEAVASPVKAETSSTKAHRAGYDLTFSPDKSVSLTALVGGDERVITAHRMAVKEAADFAEKKVQARMGGNKKPLTTGKWIAASFEHDTSRPVDGYPAPQLHTHLVVFNMTAVDAVSQMRSLQPKELFNIQTASSRVYQNRLAYELRRCGYELQQGENHAPQIKGYTKEYLEAESPRSQRIKAELERLGLTSRRASEIVSHQGREAKLNMTPDELKALHRAHAETYGHQADKVVEVAKEHTKDLQLTPDVNPKEAVDWAIRRLVERHSVIERDGHKGNGGIVQNALEYGQGRLTLDAVEREIERRKTLSPEEQQKGLEHPELVQVSHYRADAPGERYTTREMLKTEREMIEYVLSRRGKFEPINTTISQDVFREKYKDKFPYHQSLHVLWGIINSRDQIIGVQGIAGTGKTRAATTLSDIAKEHGYMVRGVAPTSGARKELEKAGIEANTLAKHNLQLRFSDKKDMHRQPNLYVLDEASLAHTRAMHMFLKHIRPTDKVVIVGDISQHQSIEAGRAFFQLQRSGMQTEVLNKIVRQRENPALKKAVETFYNATLRSHHGEIKSAINQLSDMGVVHEESNRYKRFDCIAKKYAESPSNTLIVSPDNRSRQEINEAVRSELRKQGQLAPDDYTTYALVNRQEVYQEDTTRASKYKIGDWVRAGVADKSLKVLSGDYLRVIDADTERNTITVKRSDGKTMEYDPDKKNIAASVFRVEERQFSVGERIQLTSPWKKKGIANRELGTIEKLDQHGNAEVRFDAKLGDKEGRQVRFNFREFAHFDHGYSMTSISSQGQTFRHVLAHVDTGDSRIQSLLDKVTAYVMASRASHEFHIFTDDTMGLERALDRLEVKPTALTLEQTMNYRTIYPPPELGRAVA